MQDTVTTETLCLPSTDGRLPLPSKALHIVCPCVLGFIGSCLGVGAMAMLLEFLTLLYMYLHRQMTLNPLNYASGDTAASSRIPLQLQSLLIPSSVESFKQRRQVVWLQRNTTCQTERAHLCCSVCRHTVLASLPCFSQGNESAAV